jgi:hypothetical protein
VDGFEGDFGVLVVLVEQVGDPYSATVRRSSDDVALAEMFSSSFRGPGRDRDRPETAFFYDNAERQLNDSSPSSKAASSQLCFGPLGAHCCMGLPAVA